MTHRRILGRIAREEFVGRDSELERVTAHPSRGAGARGLFLLAAPRAGESELLRQAYDELFARRSATVPLYFALSADHPPLEAAGRFFKTFIRQYIAYRRDDSTLCEAPLSLDELKSLALPADAEWISGLIDSFHRERVRSDESATIRFCFSALDKAAKDGPTMLPLIDTRDGSRLCSQLAEVLAHSANRYVFAGPRRFLLGLADDVRESALLRLEPLTNANALRLVELAASRFAVELNAPTGDLIIQQLGSYPFLINALVRAAGEAKTSLTSFLNCQRVYVDELMGGRINRHFSKLMASMTRDLQTRKRLIGVLYDSLLSEGGKLPISVWQEQLGLETAEFERLMRKLHVRELVNVDGAFVTMPADGNVWHDYLRVNYLRDVAGEPRALVVADMLQQTLKRAPRAMARKYRREASLGLRELLAEFNCQTVPGKLFHYDRFAALYKGLDDREVNAGLDAEADLLRVPQVITVAAATAFAPSFDCDEERCAIAHAFDAGDYTEASELVLIAAEIDSKLEAGRELTEEWLNRLTKLATDLNLTRTRIWLVAPEGFSPEACELLQERNAFGSSRRQVELLSARVRGGAVAKKDRGVRAEYDLVVPMGEDTELIAAQAVEQIARRAKFKPAAINQIKTALVEASINAFEHSLSPDRKLYHRFRLENDKLVITVSSRGVVPATVVTGEGIDANSTTRRGWGLKLIKSLMDEVAFQQVDDGTELRMVKYRKK